MSLILDKARELADAISNSAELQALRNTEAAVKNDDSAQNLIAEYQDLQQKIQSAYHMGDGPSEVMQSELSRLEDALESHPTVGPFLKAQYEFEQIIASLNFLITKAINGEGDPCSPSKCSGCSGGCG